ncbi:MAG: alkaline phosphatase family protein [Defluviicoccus sp.]|nr:alkaline phosphatase family protein [Defluviicoccus sp.]
MGKVRNILFIMADQLRVDYLSCYGHPHLETPNLDRLAGRGVRFDRAYVQAPVCGPSRMSFYTGRTAFSHGATWNFVPLPVGELTLGDYLRPHGMRTALVGKSHMMPDLAGMERVGLSPDGEPGLIISECGFEPYERDDGEHPHPKADPDLPYNRYLRAQGYEGPNPWNDYANSGEGPDGALREGWYMQNAPLAARVAEEHSETAYMTDRALQFLEEQGDAPWCLHLSYIKPHWPYIAPAPYHAMYGHNQILAAVRETRERDDPHPVYGAIMNHNASREFSREEVRAAVIPAYMGLIRQIDDHLGRVFRYLEETGRMDDTMIVFTSDHGDYLGDHWLGEKEFFHEQAVRIPLIVYDPDAAADATRGTADEGFIEAIDLVPTFLEARGIEIPTHIIEGRSALWRLRGGKGEVPDHAYSELDYAFYKARVELGVDPHEARLFMLRTDDWKYVHALGFEPLLFDLRNDPDEFVDLGRDPGYAGFREELHRALFERIGRRKNRTGITTERVQQRTDGAHRHGTLIGYW